MGIVLSIEQAKPIAENGISFKPPKFFISLSTSNPHNCSALCGIFRMSSFQRNIMIQINTFGRLFCFCGWSSFVCYSLTGMHFEPPHTFTKAHCGPSVFVRHETIQQESKKMAKVRLTDLQPRLRQHVNSSQVVDWDLLNWRLVQTSHWSFERFEDAAATVSLFEYDTFKFRRSIRLEFGHISLTHSNIPAQSNSLAINIFNHLIELQKLAAGQNSIIIIIHQHWIYDTPDASDLNPMGSQHLHSSCVDTK